MKHLYSTSVIVLVAACLFSAPAAAIELDGFLAEVNVAASADIGGFRTDLSATFNVSSGEVDKLFGIFDSPADVYISLRICDVARVSIERVVSEYRSHKGQGWGVIAKNLGIKPGSAEFHALKNNQLGAHSRAASNSRGNSGNKGAKGKRGK